MRITSCTTAEGQFPRSGLVLRRARLDRMSQSAQREPRLSFSGAASQMSKARMRRCGSGSRTNPPVFSGRNTGKSRKPPSVVRPCGRDCKSMVNERVETLAPVRLECAGSYPARLIRWGSQPERCSVIPALGPAAPTPQRWGGFGSTNRPTSFGPPTRRSADRGPGSSPSRWPSHVRRTGPIDEWKRWGRPS